MLYCVRNSFITFVYGEKKKTRAESHFLLFNVVNTEITMRKLKIQLQRKHSRTEMIESVDKSLATPLAAESKCSLRYVI